MSLPKTEKETKKLKEDVIKSFAAGLAIALGGYIFISLGGGLPGAVLFSVGLFCVCVYSLNLYTGKICYLLDDLKHDNPAGHPIPWFLMVLVCNIIAAVLTGLVVSLTASGSALEFATSITSAKLDKSGLSVFLSAVFCDIFIYLAVNTWKTHKDAIGAIAIVFCVAGFILTGSEHCIADAFYFAAARCNFVECLPFMLLCIAGNSVGGVFARRVFR